jgi:stage III sporulation protein AB
MKILGMILVFISSSGIGLLYSYICKKRVTDLKEWKKGLVILKNEINFSLTPLSEAFEEVSKRTKGEMSDFYLRLSQQINHNSLKAIDKLQDKDMLKMLEDTCLNNQDIKGIGSFVKNLGKNDKASQLGSISLEIENLDLEIETARISEEKNSKLFKTIGVLAGVFIIVIFI